MGGARRRASGLTPGRPHSSCARPAAQLAAHANEMRLLEALVTPRGLLGGDLNLGGYSSSLEEGSSCGPGLHRARLLGAVADLLSRVGEAEVARDFATEASFGKA